MPRTSSGLNLMNRLNITKKLRNYEKVLETIQNLSK